MYSLLFQKVEIADQRKGWLEVVTENILELILLSLPLYRKEKKKPLVFYFLKTKNLTCTRLPLCQNMLICKLAH